MNQLFTYQLVRWKQRDHAAKQLTKDMLWFFCQNSFKLHGHLHLHQEINSVNMSVTHPYHMTIFTMIIYHVLKLIYTSMDVSCFHKFNKLGQHHTVCHVKCSIQKWHNARC